MNISVLNGTGQVDYLFGLVSGLAVNQEDHIDVLDVELKQDIFAEFSNVSYYPVYRFLPQQTPFHLKVKNYLRYYWLQFSHLIFLKPRVVHFQWLDRNKFLDRVLLPLVARLKGHKVVMTVHNVNAARRDNRDSFLNRLTLRILYNLAQRLLVHTPQSKRDLAAEFRIRESKISVVKHGMNNRVAKTGISDREAKTHFDIKEDVKTILFFGNIDYYKGLDILTDSLLLLPDEFTDKLRVIIAGHSKTPGYTNKILEKIGQTRLKYFTEVHLEHVPDKEVEYYFMAADCIVLPYRSIYQSGVIFMAYAFGLPLIVTSIANFKNDVIEGKTGLLVEPENAGELAKTIVHYFNSDMYKNLENTREVIREWAWQNYSWEAIGAETRKIYDAL